MCTDDRSGCTGLLGADQGTLLLVATCKRCKLGAPLQYAVLHLGCSTECRSVSSIQGSVRQRIKPCCGEVRSVRRSAWLRPAGEAWVALLAVVVGL
jgi:hypothetical protein